MDQALPHGSKRGWFAGAIARDRSIRKRAAPHLAHDEQILHIGMLYELPPIRWQTRPARLVGGLFASVAAGLMCVGIGTPDPIDQIVFGIMWGLTVFWAGDGGPNYFAVVTNRRVMLLRAYWVGWASYNRVDEIARSAVTQLDCRGSRGWHAVSFHMEGDRTRRFWTTWDMTTMVEDQASFIAFLKGFQPTPASA